MDKVVEIQSLHKTFGSMTPALNGVDLSIGRGEMVALIGPSGSGKSTLLRHMAGLTFADRKSVSAVNVLGHGVQKKGVSCKRIRNTRAMIGCIFQQFNLINRMSVINNVLMGALGRMPRWRGSFGLFSQEDRKLAFQALARVGMEQYAYQRADSLSGGQQQRVAIARALLQQADIILADEPIASLDPESARVVMDILRDINQKDGKTVIVTLHQVDYARKYCQRAVALKKGKLHFDGNCRDLSDERLANIYGRFDGVLDNTAEERNSRIGELNIGTTRELAFAEAG